jgi:hypothetical protein
MPLVSLPLELPDQGQPVELARTSADPNAVPHHVYRDTGEPDMVLRV